MGKLASDRVGVGDFHRRVHQVPLVYRDRAGMWDPCNSAVAASVKPPLANAA